MRSAWNWALQRWPRHRDKVTYLIVGGWNSLFAYGCFSALYFVAGDRIGPSLVVAIAYVVASVNGYLTFRYVVFAPVRHPVIEYLRYQMVYLPILAINVVALPLALTYTTVGPYIAQALLALFAIVAAYVGNKYYTFRRPSTD